VILCAFVTTGQMLRQLERKHAFESSSYFEIPGAGTASIPMRPRASWLVVVGGYLLLLSIGIGLALGLFTGVDKLVEREAGSNPSTVSDSKCSVASRRSPHALASYAATSISRMASLGLPAMGPANHLSPFRLT